jgi:hypothetical protein
MKKLALSVILLGGSLLLKAQDFKIIDYKEGFETEHKADKQSKIFVNRRTQLTFMDFDKDGKMDTLVYNKSTVGGDFATIKVFDRKEDDWVILYKMSLDKFGGEDGIWFFQINSTPTASPRILIYTARSGNKFVTCITYDPVAKKYLTSEYKLNPKNLFPHKYAVNKNKLWNHTGANSGEKEAYEMITVTP